jgi:hypothetical protein
MTSMKTPWAVVVWLPDGSYRVLASFPDCETASALAAEVPGRVVLFRPTWGEQPRRHEDEF